MKTYEIVMAFGNGATFKTALVEGKDYTDAYVNATGRYPDAIITEVKEI